MKQFVIPSVNNLRFLDQACNGDAPILFLTKTNICNLHGIVEPIHAAKKKAFVHLEFMNGFKADREGLKLLKNAYKVDGVVSANLHALFEANSLGLETIYRLFLVDSISLERSENVLKGAHFSGIEVLPAINAIEEVQDLKEKLPNEFLIAGGFVRKQEVINRAFHEGYTAVDTSDPTLW